jgi:N-acetylmuramoyl-L-alanine amidase
MKVMIDPGHGGIDAGAVANNVKEKDLNLEVALYLQAILQKYKIDAQLTRYQDANLSLKDRCTISNLFKADLFISIHHNAANGKAKGYEIYYFEKSNDGKKLAELIDKQFAKLSTKRYVGDKEVAGTVTEWNYFVLEKTHAPAVLTEFCFIDNLEDLKLYDAQKQADSISNAILEFFGIKKDIEKVNEILIIDEAIKVLTDAKIISSPNYWKYNVKNLKFVDKLILNMADYILKR